VPEQPPPFVEPPRPKGPTKVYLGAMAGMSGHDPVLAAELGLYVKPRLTLSLALRHADDGGTGGLAKVRRFLFGRHGIELNLSAGAMQTFVAGAGVGYARSISRRLTGLVEAGALAGIDGDITYDVSLGFQLGF
jgi:hypothetical protein